MEDFDSFYKELQSLVQSYKNHDVMLKVEHDPTSQIIRIFGEKMNSIDKAKSGLSDASELAFTVAEHHPYWNLLYHACQIAKITLDRWDSDLSKEELDEISWSIDELKNAHDKVTARPHNDHTH